MARLARDPRARADSAAADRHLAVGTRADVLRHRSTLGATTGQLSYGLEGRMAVEIWDRQTGEQYLAFSGSYTSSLEPFAPANDRVVYRIDSGGAPGAERTQRVRLRGNILTWLGVTELTDGDYWSAEIVWERVSG